MTCLSRISLVKEFFRDHKMLSLALALCFGFSLIGANWGRVEDWNPDQMAFRGVPNNLMVNDYLKPPLTTYVARLLVLNPVDCIMRGVFHTSDKLRFEMRVLGVRLLTIFYFCAAVLFAYFSILSCSGKTAASAVALMMGTSAGLAAYTHYGTADMPLVFWMMASFACAYYGVVSEKFWPTVAGGLLAGLAAACKYNGLGVAAAIPVFFFMQYGFKTFLKKNFWMASFAVPVGFVLGCPGAVFDHTRFVQDFLYNLYITPVYAGNTKHAGYGLFLNFIPEILGWPASLLLLGSISISTYLFFSKRLNKKETLILSGSMIVFLFYFLTIGRFPRMEMRFVMPAAPFLLVAAGVGFSKIKKQLLVIILVPLIAYNLVCCFFVGWRFLNDPRMAACRWAEKNFKPGDIIERVYSPYWTDLTPGIKAIDMPLYTGRKARFENIFGNNKVIQKGISKFDTDPSLEIFTREALSKRHPDYVTFSYFAVALSGDSLVKQYYKDHMAEKLGYHIVWQGDYWVPPTWSYPARLDFIVPSMFILKKD